MTPPCPAGGGLWPIHACAHLPALASMHIGSGPGVVGLSGMQVQPLLPLRSSVTLPSAPTVMTDALCAIDAGAADSALLIGSEEVASLVLDLGRGLVVRRGRGRSLLATCKHQAAASKQDANMREFHQSLLFCP